MSSTFRTRALVLRQVDYSETSQVLHLYTRDAGKVHAIAKGAKRRRSSFQGPFDLFTLYDVLGLQKRAGNLDLLTAAEAVRVFRTIPLRYGRFCAASYALDLADELTLEGKPQPQLFDLLEGTMDALDGTAELAPVVFRFEARLAAILGLAPRLGECGLCRQPIRGREVFFSCRDNGAVCTRCRPRDPRRVRVPAEILGALARFGDPQGTVRLNPAWIDPLRRILDDYMRHLAEKEPRSMKYMRSAVLRTAKAPSRARRGKPAS